MRWYLRRRFWPQIASDVPKLQSYAQWWIFCHTEDTVNNWVQTKMNWQLSLLSFSLWARVHVSSQCPRGLHFLTCLPPSGQYGTLGQYYIKGCSCTNNKLDCWPFITAILFCHFLQESQASFMDSGAFGKEMLSNLACVPASVLYQVADFLV